MLRSSIGLLALVSLMTSKSALADDGYCEKLLKLAPIQFTNRVQFRILVHSYYFLLRMRTEVKDGKIVVTRTVEPKGGLRSGRQLMLRSYKGGRQGLGRILENNDKHGPNAMNDWLDDQIVAALGILNNYVDYFESAKNPSESINKTEDLKKRGTSLLYTSTFELEIPRDPNAQSKLATLLSDYLSKIKAAAESMGNGEFLALDQIYRAEAGQ